MSAESSDSGPTPGPPEAAGEDDVETDQVPVAHVDDLAAQLLAAGQRVRAGLARRLTGGSGALG